MKLPTAEHEANLANLFCYEVKFSHRYIFEMRRLQLNIFEFKASRRAALNLKDAVDPVFYENTKIMSKVAKELAQHGQTIPTHPLGF